MDEASLGERLRRRRRELGLQVREVADRIGVSQPTLSDWENGKTKPGEDYLAPIAAFLGIPQADLVLLRYGVTRPDIARADAIEARLDRVELQLVQMIELLRDLDRKIQDRSPGGGGEA